MDYALKSIRRLLQYFILLFVLGFQVGGESESSVLILQHATPLGDLGRILDAEALRMHLLACFSKHIFRWIQLRLSIE